MASRVILHVDMDAIYASVEQRDHPELRDKPVVVGGGADRGVVAAASYESRVYGIRSAMPMAEARRRCPDLVRVSPRMARYKQVSREIFAIFKEFTPQVEGLSLDEAFLDVTSSRRLFGSGRRIAMAIKDRIRECTALTASVGVATNKLVAKIASDLDKPDGLVVVAADQVRDVLDPLPVSVIPGIGKRTLARLQAIGVHTIAELRRAPDRDLEPVFGRFTRKTRERASGIDERPVVASRREKSISNEQTYDTDLCDRGDMERQLLRLTDRTAGRLRKAALSAGTVQVKIRQADFKTFTRQTRLKPPGNGTDQIYAVARELLATWLNGNPDARIRLLGVGCSSLAPAEQPDLFGGGNTSQASEFDRTVDEIRDRFGSGSVARARSLDRP
jgi:DNA polymerase-4